jgi:hypothetical protein
MALDVNIKGPTTGTAGVAGTGSDQLKIIPENDAIANPSNIGGVRVFSEVDQGYITGATRLYSPEADNDYRLRVSQDLLFDEEVFNYAAQNTGKHSYATATNIATWSVVGLQFSAATVSGAGALVKSYATFPNNGTQTLSMDMEVAFSAQPAANSVNEFGFFGIASANLSAPVDGVFFRLNSAGLQGIASNSGTETSTGIFPTSSINATPWTYTNAKNYQFITYLTAVGAYFWVNDGTGAVLLGSIPLPTAQSRIVRSVGLCAGFNVRALGTVTSGPAMTVGAYNVRLGGSNMTTTPAEQGNRIYGSYQGLSGGTMGSLQTYVNSTNPTAAAPSNTALTANLPGGFGGQGNVTAAAAAATDGIWCSAQVPTGSVSAPSRRLKISAVYLDLVNLGAAVATTATTIQFRLAFGHTAVSLATADAVAAKAPRSVALGIATWAVGAAVGAQPQAGPIKIMLANPIFVNPGEFVALVGKFLVGTATASQTIQFTLTYDMGWE